MARSPGGKGNSEFFVNMADNSKHLAPGGVTEDGFTGFAFVVDGMGVLEECVETPSLLGSVL